MFPPDLKDALKKAYDHETNEIAKEKLSVMLEAIKMGERKGIPICQDMGMQTYFVHIGTKMQVDGYKFGFSVFDNL
ncbi:MAG: fumarate hydratase [Planctomycetota bacterium]